MKTLILSFFALFLCVNNSNAQHYLGVKGGIGINFQKWNSLERDPLFTPNLDVFVESNDDPLSRLYASLGYHTRGSAIRGQQGFSTGRGYKFNNVVLEFGGKRLASQNETYNGYYLLGLRVEYTVGTNLGGDGVTNNSVYNFVDPNFVRKLNYGATIGGGFEYNISDKRVAFLEFSFSPDLSKQYEQTGSYRYIDFFGMERFLPPQEVRNYSFEIKVGIKFLNGYYEE